jgi:hypothetical protein
MQVHQIKFKMTKLQNSKKMPTPVDDNSGYQSHQSFNINSKEMSPCLVFEEAKHQDSDLGHAQGQKQNEMTHFSQVMDHLMVSNRDPVLDSKLNSPSSIKIIDLR